MLQSLRAFANVETDSDATVDVLGELANLELWRVNPDHD
jgi:hypothetical protein